MARFNSLLGRNKFPVPLRRELGRKPLYLALDSKPIVALEGPDEQTIGGKRWRRYAISTSRQPTRVVSPRPSGYPDKACARLSVRSAQTGPIRRRRRIDADLDRLSGEDRDICSRPCPARTPASAPCPVRPRQNRQQASGSRPLPGLLAWSFSSGNSAARLTLPISEQTSCDTSAIPPRPPAGR
jgi:hypothetical protein